MTEPCCVFAANAAPAGRLPAGTIKHNPPTPPIHSAHTTSPQPLNPFACNALQQKLRKRRLPAGTSEYQAAWILDDDGAVSAEEEEEQQEEAGAAL